MRRLVYCFDGTWNDDSGNSPITNVVKLHRSVLPEDAAGNQQIAHYMIGIATAFKGRARFLMGAAGIEVGARILAAYRQLIAEYRPGDQIYLFGFSRGAFEARSLASFIAMFGIGREDQGFSVDKAWTLYRLHRARQVRALLSPLRAASHYPVRIKCIGVWDTVGNLGNPLVPGGMLTRSLRYHDAHLPTIVDVGLHALSIDENRGPFSPTLWTLKKGADLAPGQMIEQVWFAGSHADVGGGYEESELSDISLLWMAERCMATTGLALDLELLRETTEPKPLGLQHEADTGRIYGWSRLLPFVRFIEQDRRALSPARRAVLGAWRTNRLPPDEVSLNERVHESALERFGKRVPAKSGDTLREVTYRPRNLATRVDASAGLVADATGGHVRLK